MKSVREIQNIVHSKNQIDDDVVKITEASVGDESLNSKAENERPHNSQMKDVSEMLPTEQNDKHRCGDRFPQWSMQETRDFLMIRAELDPTFMETKRNKLLWELIGTKMKEKGYNRSAEQCKCKWKNLVTRYKGCETIEPEGMKQQFPYYNELQAIFAARMQRMLWNEAEGSGVGGSKKKATQLSSDDEDENEESDGDQKGNTSGKKKRKISKHIAGSSNTSGANVNATSVNSLKEMLEDFMKQQAEMEMQWMKAYEAREEERRMREMEWRQRMEELEKERIMMERRWREKEEQRNAREEARAEKRDALINALLNKLRREDKS